MKLKLPHGEDWIEARVTKRAKSEDGTPLGTRNDNPILDTRQYEVEYDDGYVRKLQANIIAENLLSQVDSEGREFTIMDEISDHRKDTTAIPKEDGFIKHKNGNRHRKRTTRGWELLVTWKDGCLLYTSPSPRDQRGSRMPSSA